MSNFFKFFRESNRKEHLIGGVIVASLAMSPWAAIYATIVAASCLEFKDLLYGRRWDWVDWALTIAGGIIPSALWWLILH